MNAEECEFALADAIIRERDDSDFNLIEFEMGSKKMKFAIPWVNLRPGDSSGHNLWLGEKLLAMSIRPEWVANKSVLEVGSGCSGIVACALAASGAERISITDVDTDALASAKKNFDANNGKDWRGHIDYTYFDLTGASDDVNGRQHDFVLGSEIVYDGIEVDAIAKTLSSVLALDGRLALVLPLEPRVNKDKNRIFEAAMLEHFEIEKVTTFPDQGYNLIVSKKALLCSSVKQQDQYLQCLLSKQSEKLPNILVSLRTHKRKVGHWIWWVFATEKEGMSEPYPKSRVSDVSQCFHLIRDAPPEWRLILETFVKLIDDRGGDMTEVIPAIDWPRISHWVRLFAQDEIKRYAPAWLNSVVHRFKDFLESKWVNMRR